jgi:outer membrane lipoprotein-sorting protein
MQNRPCRLIRSLSMVVFSVVLLSIAGACNRKLGGTATIEDNNNSAHGPGTSVDAGPIVKRYRALDDSLNSTTKLVASISGVGERVELAPPNQVHFTMYKKRYTDGKLLMLVEFTAPSEERDRDGLITVFPDGQIEGIRYVQSTDSFIVTRDVLSEDALFGLTLQELADGQPEKYDFTVIGEETSEGAPVYRLEGKLKSGVESKFTRIVLLISKQNFAATRAEFYDNHAELARILIVNKTDQIAGHWARTKWTIDNRARQRKIDFSVVEASYDRDLSDSLFTREHLKKIASR